MTRTDLSSSAEPQVHRSISLRQALRCGFTIVLCSCLFAGAAHCRARASQDAAEAARQERTRKEPKRTKHVYTDEDLRRARILTPDDEARVEARRQQQPAHLEEQTQVPMDADGQIGQLPLGDIARRYRSAKLAAQARDQFHLPFDEPVFAVPVIPITTVSPSRSSSSAARPNPAPSRRSFVATPAVPSPTPLRRVDPFLRRPAPPAPRSVERVAPNAPQPPVGATIAPSLKKSHAATPAIVPSAPKAEELKSAQPSEVANTSLSRQTVTLQPGDSLWKLAQQNLGRGSRWPELLAANPGIGEPTHIAVGTEIVVPAKLTGLKSNLKVTVKPGDTLSRIAQSKYGRAAAWRCMAQVNPEIADVDRIYAGQQLLLPFSCQR